MTDRNRTALALMQVMQTIAEALASDSDVDDIWQALRSLFAELDDDSLAGLLGFIEDHMSEADRKPASRWIWQGMVRALHTEIELRASAAESDQ